MNTTSKPSTAPIRPIIWNASKGGGLIIVGVEGMKKKARNPRSRN